MAKLKICLQYFWLCLKMGALSFGGGYGMLPIMEREFCSKRGFVSREEMTDIIAMAQSVPGMVAINMIIFIGYKRKGVLCALMGVLGMIIPSITIIVLIALAYSVVIGNKYVDAIFMGVRAGVIALFTSAIIKLFKSSVKDIFTLVVAIISTALLALSTFLNLDWLNPVYLILLGAAAGLIKTTFIKGKI